MTGRDALHTWYTPVPEQVADGVFRIPLPLPDDGLRAVNTYAIVDAGGLVLVDPGQAVPESAEQLRRSLDDLGYRLSDVRGCLATHIHRDHYTQAVALRRQTRCWVALGVGERESMTLLQDPRFGRIERQIDLLPACGADDLVPRLAELNTDDGVPDGIWEDPDEWLVPGVDVALRSRTLTVHSTPGHTRGHVVLHDRTAGLLFSGDHLLPHITPSIGFEPAARPGALAAFLGSLRRMRDLPDARMLPAHGPVAPSVHARVDELLAHHEERLGLTLQQVRDGRRTVAEVARGLGWTRRHRRLDDLDAFNAMLAVLETRAHLDLLCTDGRLRSRFDGHVLRFDLPV